ncbi:MAG: plasminogen-binding N-terminal domain-containing protein [Campylobacterota bacterium]|nr:plasminogen-binding N-terminal domain-containing protein [Campylobacterota bacterium]
MRLLLLLFLPYFLYASAIETPLLRIDNDKATIQVPTIDIGVSGFIVRHFNEEHSAIIANAVVSDVNTQRQEATLTLSDYDGLVQNSLPNGTWTPKEGDIAVLAFSYERAMLIAPSDDIYHNITSRIKTINWVHPDGFAAFLSYRGHPTPLAEDIQNYCGIASVGLVYFYSDQALFTLDCKSLTLLQITPAAMEVENQKLPFYSMVENIEENWFGEGSDPLESYDPHYMELLVLNNPKNKKLYEYIKSNDSNSSVLLDEFEIED